MRSPCLLPTLRLALASVVLLLFASISVCLSDTVTYDWRVTSIPAAFDGVSLVSVETYGINDKPADQAVIDVELGQEVEVRVTNELNESTCLHWHGLKQLGTAEMDGVSGITQCHIQPNTTAVYRFTPDKPGTFWWHSHHTTQYAFGLRGPLIVHAPVHELQPWEQDIDAEYTVQLADIYHAFPTRAPMWDSLLINNRGRYNCTAAAVNNLTECTDNQPLSRFRFQQGKKYLLRLINMAALAPFQFSIDDHDFQVIAADSESLVPSDPINSLVINAGQRYDILVQAKTAPSGPIGSFWMRAEGLNGLPWTAGSAETAAEGFNAEALAIVNYEAEDEDAAEPTTLECTDKRTIGEFDFQPLMPAMLPPKASDRSVLEFDLRRAENATGGPLGYFSIDGGDYNHFEEPDQPPLLTIAGGLATHELPVTANARAIEYGKHVEVVLVNDMNEQHPFHLHTHTPWVIGSGQASREDIMADKLPPMKLRGAMMRDVYTVPPCTTDENDECVDVGYLVLRFTADNPGVWIMHCHIDWHLADGLAMIFVEGEDTLQKMGVDSFANSMLSVCKGE